MELPITIGLAAVMLLIAVFAGWRGAQPADPIRGVRMAPWRAIMLLAATIVLVLLVRAAGLLGLTAS